MEKLNIDVGLKSYQFVDGGACLTFNPSDPNVYARYIDALDHLKKLEAEFGARAKSVDEDNDAILLMREADGKMKTVLNGIFGAGNDFDAILVGANLMALTSSGATVVSNVIEALTPILEAGARAYVDAEVEKV